MEQIGLCGVVGISSSEADAAPFWWSDEVLRVTVRWQRLRDLGRIEVGRGAAAVRQPRLGLIWGSGLFALRAFGDLFAEAGLLQTDLGVLELRREAVRAQVPPLLTFEERPPDTRIPPDARSDGRARSSC